MKLEKVQAFEPGAILMIFLVLLSAGRAPEICSQDKRFLSRARLLTTALLL